MMWLYQLSFEWDFFTHGGVLDFAEQRGSIHKKIPPKSKLKSFKVTMKTKTTKINIVRTFTTKMILLLTNRMHSYQYFVSYDVVNSTLSSL